jgi:hypothetical protein
VLVGVAGFSFLTKRIKVAKVYQFESEVVGCVVQWPLPVNTLNHEIKRKRGKA